MINFIKLFCFLTIFGFIGLTGLNIFNTLLDFQTANIERIQNANKAN